MRNRRQRLLILAALVICAAAFLVLALSERLRDASTPETTPTPAPTETAGDAGHLGALDDPDDPGDELTVMYPLTSSDPPSDEPDAEEMFIIRAYQGRIAVFRYGETSPGQILDTYISTLREADRRMLEQGLVIYGQEALAHFLEDFSS